MFEKKDQEYFGKKNEPLFIRGSTMNFANYNTRSVIFLISLSTSDTKSTQRAKKKLANVGMTRHNASASQTLYTFQVRDSCSNARAYQGQRRVIAARLPRFYRLTSLNVMPTTAQCCQEL